jgi:CheY-like chemotaxis protein
MDLDRLLATQTDNLIQQALNYAMISNAAQFEAVDAETWRVFIEGVCRLFLAVLSSKDQLPARKDDNPVSRDDPVIRFGEMKAHKHRAAGLSLSTLLILANGCRRGCVDLIRQEQSVEQSHRARWEDLVERFFDSVDLGLCLAWPASEGGQRAPEVQEEDSLHEQGEDFEESPGPALKTPAQPQQARETHVPADSPAARESTNDSPLERVLKQEERILVIDADPDMTHQLQSHLGARGYRVQVAHSAAQAFRRAKIDRPDLIVLDVLLSDADGLTVLEWLKVDRHTRDIPVVLMSSLPDDGQWESFGAAGYLSKPVLEGELLDCTDRVLGLG